MDEQLYFVHICGEAFDQFTTISELRSHEINCDEDVEADYMVWKIQPESEAM